MACLFTGSSAAAHKFRYEAQAGNIGINVGVAAPMAFFPFCGLRESFFGDLHPQGREAIFEGLSRRRTFAATHNIVIDFRIGEAFMGEETTVQEAPRLEIKVIGPQGARRIKAPYFSVTCRNTRMRFPPRNLRILCSE